MRLLLALVLVLTFVVFACGNALDGYHPADPGGPVRTFVVSPEFPAAERAALDRAVARWNLIAIEKFALRDGKPGEAEASDHGVFRLPYRGAYWKELSDMNGGADIIGVHITSKDQVGIVDVLSVELFEAVALHEFGHAHGLAHVAPPAIMAAAAGSVYDFAPNDMAECMRVGACIGSKVVLYGDERLPEVTP